MDALNLHRREFLRRCGFAAAATVLPASTVVQGGEPPSSPPASPKPIRIKSVDSNFEREPLVRPFGFKGGYVSEIWQTAVLLESDSGVRKIGLCTQSPLWSDAEVFAAHTESGGNALMYALTERALQMLKGQSFTSPIQLLDGILEELYRYGQKITNHPNLRKTFVLNSLVGVDQAAWLLYAAENGLKSFDALIPSAYRPALSHRHSALACIPLMTYGVPIDEIKAAAEQGFFFMKIKIGQPGTQEEMLAKDILRISAIHQAIGSIRTPHTKDGRIPYYFDANGRYEKKETLLRLLDHARKIGAFDQIAIVEEPFPEELEISVKDIPVRLAADESAHTETHARQRIEMGYRAIALKPIAKTMSVSMKIAQTAHEHGVPCFCADLTVNPILIEWNKVVAARLAPFQGLTTGLLETNGHQNYKNWDTMRSYHPLPNASWTKIQKGLFHLDDEYWRQDGGIFLPSAHYEQMFAKT